MFKKMKLGVKIGLGFATLLAIAATLGILAIVNMEKVEEQSVMLDQEYVPEVAAANRIERSSFRTMYAMRAYGFTSEEQFLSAAKDNIKALHERLDAAKALGDEAANLKALRPAVEKIETSLRRYEQLVEDTIEVNAAMEVNKKQLDEAAGRYMDNCFSYLAGQTAKMGEEISLVMGIAALNQRLTKITVINDIIDAGNFTRIAAWRSQAERDPRIIQNASQNIDAMDAKFDSLRKITSQAEDLERIDGIQEAAKQYKAAMNAYLDNWLKNRELGVQRGQVGDSVLAETRELSVAGMGGAERIANAAVASLSSASHILIFGLGIALLTGMVIAFVITRSITGPVIQGIGLAQEIAKGDFSKRLGMDRADEIGVLANALDGMADGLARNATVAEQIADGNLNVEVVLASEKDQLGAALAKMVESLNDLLGQVQVAGEQIASGSGQVSDASQSLSQGATESASSLEEISASLNQLASQTSVNAENATQANNLASEASRDARQGSEQMQAMVSAMTEINDASQNISKIIKTIDEIAFQTNLLALNAAVEAARAGQHGKGFAVVAEEVRNLAARSAKAAEETSELIEGSVQKAENGSVIANQTAEALQNIVSGIGQVTDLVAEISAASSEQAQGVNQINQGISQIDSVTQQNTANAEESAAAAEELFSQAEQMRQMMMRFTLKAKQARVSLNAPAKPSAAEKSGGWETGMPAPQQLAMRSPIVLDDDEFGKF